jgi:hypothetical protein
MIDEGVLLGWYGEDFAEFCKGACGRLEEQWQQRHSPTSNTMLNWRALQGCLTAVDANATAAYHPDADNEKAEFDALELHELELKARGISRGSTAHDQLPY